MDFLNDDCHSIYRRYLVPTLGSALVVSIYSFVDTIAVGQYAGPVGSAAIAVINPVYVLQFFIAMLCASGGSIHLGCAKGAGKNKEANNYFTVSVIAVSIITCIMWIVFEINTEGILRLLGADGEVLDAAMEYGKVIIHAFPVIVAPDFLGAYLRIDHDPKRALGAVVTGSCLNMFLDWLLVFPVNLGMRGAALATVIGNALQTGIMLTHFVSKANHLELIKPFYFKRTASEIIRTGISSSFLDLGNVILLVLTNNQMQKYGGESGMAAWGVVNTTAVFAQALFTGGGQAIQPAVAENYGAGKIKRTQSFLYLAVRTSLLLSAVFTLIGEMFPVQITRIFMKATPEVLTVASPMIRTYYLSFPFLSLNVLSTYYLQAVMENKISLRVALTRSLFLPCVLLIELPLIFQMKGVYSAVPVSELCVFLWQYWYYREKMHLSFRK